MDGTATFQTTKRTRKNALTAIHGQRRSLNLRLLRYSGSEGAFPEISRFIQFFRLLDVPLLCGSMKRLSGKRAPPVCNDCRVLPAALYGKEQNAERPVSDEYRFSSEISAVAYTSSDPGSPILLKAEHVSATRQMLATPV